MMGPIPLGWDEFSISPHDIAAEQGHTMTASHPAQKDYRVSLELFEGPLDLLLFLVKRAEVDLQDIPIAQITDQYLDVLRNMRDQDIDVDQAAEFLVMAATLIEIKSRTLVPATPEVESESKDGDEGDPRDTLIRQLLAYQRVRHAGESLQSKRADFERMWPVCMGHVREDLPAMPEGLEIEDVHAMDLSEAWERIASAIDFARLGDHVVELDDTPIALYEEDLVDRLSRREGRSLTLQEAFAGQRPVQRVGMFLAVLELVRRFRVSFQQEDDGPLNLMLRPDRDEIQDDPSPPA